MDRYSNTQGLIINHQTLRESDLIITLFTKDLGKIRAHAKGIKNITSTRLSSLELGNFARISLYHKDNYFWITEAKTISSFVINQKTLSQHQLLFYFLETLNCLLAENQVIPNLYELCQQTIAAINKNSYSQFIKYQIKIIELLGFGCPLEIKNQVTQNNLTKAHRQMLDFIESIIEKPLACRKLF